jgi:hypothetical protein
MVDEKTVIDKKLIEIQENIIQLLDPGYYKNKIKGIQVQTLNNSIVEFKYQLNLELQALPQIIYLEQQVNNLIEGLNEKITEANFQNATPQFLSARITTWNDLRGELNKFQSRLTKNLNDEDLVNDASFDDIVLTRDQLALFIIYLRDSKIISKSISDTEVTNCFHIMTGHSAEKLRQKISGIAKSERNQITDLESNYNKLQDILRLIITLIEEDKRKAILKKVK